jgi:hypothetical protein
MYVGTLGRRRPAAYLFIRTRGGSALSHVISAAAQWYGSPSASSQAATASPGSGGRAVPPPQPTPRPGPPAAATLSPASAPRGAGGWMASTSRLAGSSAPSSNASLRLACTNRAGSAPAPAGRPGGGARGSGVGGGVRLTKALRDAARAQSRRLVAPRLRACYSVSLRRETYPIQLRPSGVITGRLRLPGQAVCVLVLEASAMHYLKVIFLQDQSPPCVLPTSMRRFDEPLQR